MKYEIVKESGLVIAVYDSEEQAREYLALIEQSPMLLGGATFWIREVE